MFNSLLSINSAFAEQEIRRIAIVARYAIDCPHGRRDLPSITETLPVAEAFRRTLLAKCRTVLRIPKGEHGREELCRHCPSLIGKDLDGQPLRGHQHAYFIPIDEDGDGHIDHITVVAERGFAADEVRALDRLRRVSLGEGEPLRLLLVGLGTQGDFTSPLFAESAVWVSATPFVATRYPKRRGQKKDRPEDYATPQDFTRHVLGQELGRLRGRRTDVPAVEEIEPLAAVGPGSGLRTIQFTRFRHKRGDDGGRRPSGLFRLTFAAPVGGPLCLGHSCHFGLGLFWPETP